MPPSVHTLNFDLTPMKTNILYCQSYQIKTAYGQLKDSISTALSLSIAASKIDFYWLQITTCNALTKIMTMHMDNLTLLYLAVQNNDGTIDFKNARSPQTAWNMFINGIRQWIPMDLVCQICSRNLELNNRDQW